MADKAFKTRGKRCEIHGILYDPELTSGCARCRKGGFQRTSSPKLLSVLLTMLALTAVAGYVINGALTSVRSDTNEASPTTEVAPEASSTRVVAVDPTPFEGRIRALESALFDTDETDFAVVTDRVASEAAELEVALRRATLPAAITASLADFAAETRGASATVDAIQGTRDRWVRLRSSAFRPAPWMVSGSARTDSGGLAIRNHLEIAQALASAALGASGEPLDTADAEADGATLAAEVASLQARMPPSPPLDADPQLLASHRALDQMLIELGAVASSPASPDRQARLEVLATRASDTEAELETLLGS